MAIAKMQKISLVTEPELKDDMINTLKKSQKVDVNDLSVLLEDSDIGFKNNATDDLGYYEDLYQRAEKALDNLSEYGKQLSFKDKITQKRERLTTDDLHQKVNIDALESLLTEIENLVDRREEISSSQATLSESLEEKEEMLKKWGDLDVDPNQVVHLDNFAVFIGTIANNKQYTEFKNEIEQMDVTLSEIYKEKREVGLTLVGSPEQRGEIRALLSEYSFSQLSYDFGGKPSEALPQSIDSLQAEIEKLEAEDQDIVDNLNSLKNSEEETLKLGVEELYNRIQDSKVSRLSFDNDHLVLLSGWVDVTDVDALKEELNQTFETDSYALILEDTTEEEIEENKVPVKMENNSIVEPFESITEMYSTPGYKEIDPTIYVAFFYMIFFGMMLADLGYAIVLWAITLFAMKVMDLRRQTYNTIKMFHLVSYPTMIVGLLYGSFFGVTLPIQIINPTEDAIVLMIISLVVGYFHLLAGLCLNVYLRIKEKDYAAAFNDGIGWILMFIGLAVGIAGYLLDISWLITVAIVLALAGVLGILIVSIFSSQNKGIGAVKGLYNLYDITSYVGDFVSYTRLMALGISGGSIALAFNTIFGILPVPVRFTLGILLIIALHAFNLFLSFLSAYVHGLRLVFVEFFGKFYEGGGKAFKTIPTLQKYIKFNDVEETK